MAENKLVKILRSHWDELLERSNRLHDLERVRPLDDWHEDDGEALWWAFPIKEAPYVGSPLCDNWPGYHTHWTLLPAPAERELVRRGVGANVR